MAVPTYQNFTEAKDDGSIIVLDKPAGVVENDLMIAAISMEYRGDDHSFLVPTGWTILEELNFGNDVFFGVYYKVAGASEPATYTFTDTVDGEDAYSFIVRISGNDRTTPINVSSGFATGNTNTPTCSSVTTTLDDCLVLRMFGAEKDDITEDGGEPAGTTVITVDENTDVSAGAAYESQAVAGATGAAAFALTDSNDWVAITIAVSSAYPGKATNPFPEDGEAFALTTTDLSWDASVNTDSYNVYFGTTAVLGAAEFQGNQVGTTFTPPVTLDKNTTYYWRIDSVGELGTTTGDIWSFTTGGKRIACVGDLSDHAGEITTSNQDGTLLVGDLVVAVEGASHVCPIAGHGTTAIVAVTTKSYHNNKLILTSNALAGCGALITPEDRGVYVE